MKVEVEFGNVKETVDVEDIYDYVYDTYTDEIERAFDETVEECAEKPFKVLGYSFNEADVLKQIDCTAYWQEVYTWYDVLMEDVHYELERENDTSIGYINIRIVREEIKEE